MDNNNEIMDNLAREFGEPVTEKDVLIENLTKKDIEKMTNEADKKLNNYVYGGGGPTPGESISEELDRITDVKKEDAINSLVMQSAMMKAEQERQEAEKKPMTAEERAEHKKQVVDYLMYQAEEQYFVQHKFVMDGRTKRRTRAKISRDYDKGKYRPKKGKSLND